MAVAPKCKFCGVRHWLSEPHEMFERSVAVTAPGRGKTATTVTQPVTPVVIVTNPVTGKHCPTCSCSRVYKDGAAKQKAYRERKRG